jgi:hypothetical protein
VVSPEIKCFGNGGASGLAAAVAVEFEEYRVVSMFLFIYVYKLLSFVL